jgi:hypothetical protein
MEPGVLLGSQEQFQIEPGNFREPETVLWSQEYFWGARGASRVPGEVNGARSTSREPGAFLCSQGYF